MERILILGSGGAGKSTLALQLGKVLGLEVFHLDQHYWQPNWVEPSREDWLVTLDQLTSHAKWIIDGNFSGSLEQRLAKCDTVILLDLPRLTCLVRILKRRWIHRNRIRLDMAEGCPEKLDLKFLGWIWNFPNRTRPKIISRIENNGRVKNLVILRSRKDVKQFLSALD
jgi:adenylate kinase family enzyme